jgi:hypothetical protein
MSPQWQLMFLPEKTMVFRGELTEGAGIHRTESGISPHIRQNKSRRDSSIP